MGPAPSAPASEFPSQQEVSSCAGISQHTFVHSSQSNMQMHLPLRDLDHPSYFLTRAGRKQPSCAQERGERPIRTGTWARHVNQIKLARTLIRMMSKHESAGVADEDDDCSDISQAENLLETYFAQVCPCIDGTDA